MSLKSKLLFIFSIVVILSAQGCTLKSSPESTTAISFDQTEYEVQPDKAVSAAMWFEPYRSDGQDIVLISDNEDIAYVHTVETEPVSVSGSKYLKIYISGVSEGQTTIYAKTTDGSVESNKITVTVASENPEEDNSREVFVNYEGRCYHFSSSCAGKTAHSTTLNEALKSGKDPCSRCVS